VKSSIFAVGSFQLLVNPIPYATGLIFYSNCDYGSTPFDAIQLIDLTQYASTLLNGQNPSLHSVTYYTFQSNADSGISPERLRIKQIFTDF